MKRLSFVSLLILSLANTAHAKQGHVLHGLFCNTKAQIEGTFDHIRHNITPETAVEMMNEKDVVCVHANRIHYMVINPIIIDKVQHHKRWLMMYEATLIGVLVGEIPRPVVPPIRTFFVPSVPITGVGMQGGA